MKKVFSVLLLLGFVSTAFAQNSLEAKRKELANAEAALTAANAKVEGLKAQVAELTPPEFWKKGGFSALNFNSLGLTNWAAGGVNSNSVTALGNLYANYNKNKFEWINNLDLAYGLIQNKGQDIRKNDDKIDFLTKAGVKATDRLSYAALLNFKSQFAEGFDFSDPTILDENRVAISNFLAPAFVLASAGLDYKVTDALSVYLSPATGKFTIVNDEDIANTWTYIPQIANPEKPGEFYYANDFRSEFGALLNATYARDLTDRIGLKSTVGLFNNYTDINKDNRKNIDVDWQTFLNMKLTDYISASLFGHVLHDNDIAVPLYADDGITLTGTGPRTQFKRMLGVGFSYKF